MKQYKLLYLFVLMFGMYSCGSNSGKKTNNFSLKITNPKKSYKLGESIQAEIKNQKTIEVDSTQFFFENKRVKSSNNAVTIQLDNQKLGNQEIKAIVYYKGDKDTLQAPVKIYNNKPPQLYTYKIINKYPHDPKAYTQGLEFLNDTLYESTGEYGHSSLRKTDVKTGKVYDEIELENQYFGEGLSILNNKLYQLTWQKHIGFIYTLDLKQEGTFQFNQSKEGWGLCNNGKQFYKSDGTEKIWILNGQTLAEEDYIQATTDNSINSKLNELEWVKGKIYANSYQYPGVAIINPVNGAIEGVIDFRGLIDEIGNKEDLDLKNHVLNGIAYNPNSNKLYVTGKDWDTMFEVELVKE